MPPMILERKPKMPLAHSQRGAATLVVVMILFFVVSLAAAYASRNLIFEQRTSANQYQSTKNAETAEAGIEWALTMLNSGRIDENCQPTTDVAKDSFRQRYLTYNPTTGGVTRKLNSDPYTKPYLWAACSFTGGTWTCSCPSVDGDVATLPSGTAAFGLRFVNQIGKPGTVRIEVNGCNNFDINCVTGVLPDTFADRCQSMACSLLTQFSALRMLPTAPVTAKVTVDGTQITAYNTEASGIGVTLHTGTPVGIAAANMILGGLPGTPAVRTIRESDLALTNLEADSDECNFCLFSSVFGLRPSTYRDQPAGMVVDCTANCTSIAATTGLGKALAAARGSVVWLSGPGGLTLSSAASNLGTPTSPVLIVSEGPVTLSGGAKITGMIYASSITLNNGEVQGAIVSANSVNSIGGAPNVVTYDSTVLGLLQKLNGSFVRLPGSWRDFP